MIRQGLERILGLTRSLFLDEVRCPGCGLVVQAAADRKSSLCPDCRLALAPQEAAGCPGCGQQPEAQPGQPQEFAQLPPVLCRACQALALKEPPRPWGRLASFGPYEGRLRELILAYKFEGRLGLGRQLQECLVAAFERQAAVFPELCACELVVPVPLHVRRLSWRGFNQSSELARLLARRRGLPLRQEALLRVRRTVPQMELGRLERAENIRGAFAASPEILAGRTALLVDDIMTTGSTLEECSRMMRAAGAAQVHVLVLARA